ncbi:MAG: SDR family NAD(P)-dependent oxidoreductase [Planctomycetota bacterium]|nr:SDR family NAD(P)-dependent oxidoreductase [Planctomycetota bacterium]
MESQVALITGAGRGIGAATARLLASKGHKIICSARSENEISAVAEEIRQAGGEAVAIPCDVTKKAEVESLIAGSLEAFGALDILINNAGTCDPCELVDMSDEVYHRVMDGNMTSTFLCSRAAVAHMLPRQSGQIINVASISGVRGSSKFPGFTAYAAAKAAVIVFTEALAAEVKEAGIRVNAISPGSVDTKMLRDVAPGLVAGMSPEEVAQSILYLVEARAVNGSNFEIFG